MKPRNYLTLGAFLAGCSGGLRFGTPEKGIDYFSVSGKLGGRQVTYCLYKDGRAVSVLNGERHVEVLENFNPKYDLIVYVRGKGVYGITPKQAVEIPRKEDNIILVIEKRLVDTLAGGDLDNSEAEALEKEAFEYVKRVSEQPSVGRPRSRQKYPTSTKKFLR